MSELLPEIETTVELVPGRPTLVPTTIAAKARRKRFGIGFWVAVVWIVVLVFLAVFAGVLPFIKAPNLPYPGNFRATPSAEHWFGGDAIGRDIFSRVVYGARVSLGV